jgi:small-conductance mechanosensitive channel
VLDNFDVYRISDFADSAILFRVRVKTREGEQWRIGRELRLRIKRRFEKEGIEIPFPHHTLYWGESRNGKAPPLRLKTVNAGHVDASTTPISQSEGER